MSPSRTELAVLNNVCWYDAMFASHDLAGQSDGKVWRSDALAPPFHSNLLVLAPATTLGEVASHIQALERLPRPGGWSLKDSHANLDLAGLGFTCLFQAEWVWRDASAPPARGTPSLALRQVACAAARFPNLPLVGYERGADLDLAQNAGFVPIGPLCVWRRGD